MWKPSILYAEDDPPIREQMEEFLQRFASELYIAADGEEGLRLFREHRPDLVISDIIMPRIDGLAMVRAIRELDPEIPVLLTTARSDHQFFVETIELKVDGYIPKPVDLEILAEKIRKISEKMAMERAYERTRILLDEIARYQPGLVAVLDERQRPIFLNAGMGAYLGFRAEQIREELGTPRLTRRFWRTLLSGESASSRPEGEDLPDDPLSRLEKREFLTLESPGRHQPRQFKIDIARIEESGHTVLSLSEVTHMVQEKLHYEEMARRDVLTGLYNRHYFNTTVSETLDDCSRRGLPVTLILADLDHFKRINDRYGHLTGDEVLIEFSRLLRERAGREARLARWGGEEFTILLPGVGAEEGFAWAEDLRKSIQERSFGSPRLRITCSMGLTHTLPSATDTPSGLFYRADRALYRAKERGRNRVEIEDPSA